MKTRFSKKVSRVQKNPRRNRRNKGVVNAIYFLRVREGLPKRGIEDPRREKEVRIFKPPDIREISSFETLCPNDLRYFHNLLIEYGEATLSTNQYARSLTAFGWEISWRSTRSLNRIAWKYSWWTFVRILGKKGAGPQENPLFPSTLQRRFEERTALWKREPLGIRSLSIAKTHKRRRGIAPTRELGRILDAISNT